LKRFGKPEEIAELLAFCAGEKAGYLTGADILCDGGAIAALTLQQADG
jgi:NAD(P)-dependent dehydrogenase (short-subunit alcohol dehydrogenase family)